MRRIGQVERFKANLQAVFFPRHGEILAGYQIEIAPAGTVDQVTSSVAECPGCSSVDKPGVEPAIDRSYGSPARACPGRISGHDVVAAVSAAGVLSIRGDRLSHGRTGQHRQDAADLPPAQHPTQGTGLQVVLTRAGGQIVQDAQIVRERTIQVGARPVPPQVLLVAGHEPASTLPFGCRNSPRPSRSPYSSTS